MDDWIYWIALKKIRNLGDLAINSLISKFRSPSVIFDAKEPEITSIPGVGKKTFNAINSFDGWNDAEQEVKFLVRHGLRIITINDEEYPVNLKNIYNPPPLLYIKGELKENDNYPVAIVGSRLCDHYGRRVTRKIAGGLAEMGITITSGMAMGVDAISHSSCMEKGSRTIAVLGNGIDIAYPPENRDLYKRIVHKGVLISEYPPGTLPEPGNFPERNRLISGISLGVVVIQASENSGSLITASLAVQQNREVFAVPGNIDSKLSAGTNELIKRGAKLVSGTDDIIEEIVQLRHLVDSKENGGTDQNKGDEIRSEDERLVVELLENRPHHVDEIAKKLNIDSSEILTLLLDMELREIIVQTPGKYFQLA